MEHTIKGGHTAHFIRRFIHIAILVIPIVYYYFLIPHISEKILHVCILLFIFLVFLFEKLRVRMRLVLFGQRLNEASRISAFAWTMLAMGIVLFFTPLHFAMPIVAVCALVDPLMGELRLHHVNKKIVITLGIFLALIIWFAAGLIYHFPFWYGILPAIIAVIVEQPNLKWIDDNALMLLVPMLVLML